MTIYITLYIFLLLFAFLEKTLDKGKKVSFIFVSLAIICIVGLRKECMGYDLPGYLNSFDDLSNMPLLDTIRLDHYLNYEKGYVIFNTLFGFISTNHNAFLFTCVLISFLPIAFFAYRNSSRFTLSIFVYLALPPFLLLFSGLRQSIAIGLCLFSYEFVKKRKIIPFALIVAFAMTFHSSAMLFFVVYPLYSLKVGLKGRWISVLALAFIYLAKLPLYMILGKMLKSELILDNNGAYMLMIVFILTYIFCFLYSKQTKEENALLNMFWLACFCQMFGSLNSIAIRVGYYFMLALLPLLPNVLNNIENQYEKVSLKMVISLCFIAAGIFFIYNGDFAQTYPHYWFWD